MIKVENKGKECITEIEGKAEDIMAELVIMICRLKKLVPENALREIVDVAFDGKIDKFLEVD